MLINREQLNFDLTAEQVAVLTGRMPCKAMEIWYKLLEELATEGEIAKQAHLVDRLYQLMKLAEAE